MQLTGASNPLVTSRVSQSVISNHKMNFNVKIINPLNKKEFETYVLRDVLKDRISTPTLLRKEFIQQFGESLVLLIKTLQLAITRVAVSL